jgi:hypothetical protein
MPKKKIAKKKKAPTKRAKVGKQAKKRIAAKQAAKKRTTPAKRSARDFPRASALPDLSEEHIAKFTTTAALAEGVDDPPGACMTVDTSGRMSCRITRQSMCTGPNSKFYAHKACPAG